LGSSRGSTLPSFLLLLLIPEPASELCHTLREIGGGYGSKLPSGLDVRRIHALCTAGLDAPMKICTLLKYAIAIHPGEGNHHAQT